MPCDLLALDLRRAFLVHTLQQVGNVDCGARPRDLLVYLRVLLAFVQPMLQPLPVLADGCVCDRHCFVEASDGLQQRLRLCVATDREERLAPFTLIDRRALLIDHRTVLSLHLYAHHAVNLGKDGELLLRLFVELVALLQLVPA